MSVCGSLTAVGRFATTTPLLLRLASFGPDADLQELPDRNGRFRSEKRNTTKEALLKGFFITTIDRWSAKNQAEDPFNNGDFDPDKGVPPRLAAEQIGSDDMDILLLQARLGNEVESEHDTDTSGYSEVQHPPTEQLLARNGREETETRLHRRFDERRLGEFELRLGGVSPEAIENDIAHLEDRLNGLSEERTQLRRDARKLAPHNMTEMIGSPPRRGHN